MKLFKTMVNIILCAIVSIFTTLSFVDVSNFQNFLIMVFSLFLATMVVYKLSEDINKKTTNTHTVKTGNG